MNFYEVIYNRKTVRKFLGKPVDLEIIKRILEAVNAAPTWNHKRATEDLRSDLLYSRRRGGSPVSSLC
ncbi:MAG: nitroreductase family protein [Mogibacterium sp.]|nr:nitroreductase family protein [Mogibacterium sp.]